MTSCFSFFYFFEQMDGIKTISLMSQFNEIRKESSWGSSKHSPAENSLDLFPEITEPNRMVTVSVHRSVSFPLLSFHILPEQWRLKGSWSRGFQAAGIYMSKTNGNFWAWSWFVKGLKSKQTDQERRWPGVAGSAPRPPLPAPAPAPAPWQAAVQQLSYSLFSP